MKNKLTPMEREMLDVLNVIILFIAETSDGSKSYEVRRDLCAIHLGIVDLMKTSTFLAPHFHELITLNDLSRDRIHKQNMTRMVELSS